MTSISENTQKLLDKFRGSHNEMDKIIAIYQAAKELPELQQVYLIKPLASRYDELVSQMVHDLQDE